MSTPLSLDLRVRVVAAAATGLSHRQVAEGFGVSAASVSRWRAREREQGDPGRKAMGGDRRSHRIESHGELILSLYEATPDITLEELRAALAELGVSVSYGGLWRFFDRHDITVRSWWHEVGRHRYPEARHLTITADGGGSRLRLWKVEIAALDILRDAFHGV